MVCGQLQELLRGYEQQMMASNTRRLAKYHTLVLAGQARLMPCPGFVWLESLKKGQDNEHAP